MFDVSVIILTFNEEKNIRHAIESVSDWAETIFVVDSYSTDRTVDIALEYERVFVVQHEFVNFSAQWNWALQALPIKTGWTLKLDADERVTPEFKSEVPEVVRNHPGISGIYFRRKMFFMGQPIVNGGYSSTYKLHLWRTGKAVFENREVNEHTIIDGPTLRITSFIDHHDFKSISDWIAKHNRYSSMESRCLIQGNVAGDITPRLSGSPYERKAWLRGVYRKMPFRHVAYFLYRYLYQRAFMDGMVGFRYCLLHAFYRYWIDLKYEEYLRSGEQPEVQWPTRGSAHPVVKVSTLQRQVDGALNVPSAAAG